MVLITALARELPSVSCASLEIVARAHGGDIPAPVLAHARSLHRGEVSYTDERVGRLVSGIEAKRWLDETLVVFTADHGGCLEHRVYFEYVLDPGQISEELRASRRALGYLEVGER
ncbi:MAG TPA: sulfatase-like hydrolase/transferase [Myxococcota bacterium]|nr:sulfatase-like hydrolase/transferase [Myxococcota bacterium]